MKTTRRAADNVKKRKKRIIVLSFLFCSLCSVVPVTRAWLSQVSQPAADEYIGNAACAGCHSGLSNSFLKTPMALSSGPMDGSVFQENPGANRIRHDKTGFVYTIRKGAGATVMEFERETPEAIRGERKIDFYIGSGNHGRGYVYALDGYLYQLPIGYYSQAQKWEMSPGFETGGVMKLTRPIQQGCLECHASRLRPIAGTENRYQAKPFLENGISCERCHGPGGRHAALMKSGAGISVDLGIVNPAKLEGSRRASICAQCHLSGEARIERAGRSLATYRPGDRLSDHVLSFVAPAAEGGNLVATGHVETLERSACKQKSGERMSCTSCHNPHFKPAPAEAAAYFNGKCVSCHTVSACKSDLTLRKTRGDSCIDCHMPKRPTADIGHNVFTDHSIPRAIPRDAARRGTDRKPFAAGTETLISFWGEAVRQRDLGMAYLSVAGKRGGAYFARAAELLKGIESELDGDAAALLFLGKIYEREKNPTRAARCYEKVLQADPSKLEAGVDLGTIYAKSGRLPEAIRLWEDVLRRNPGYEIARLNLAFAHLENGNFEVAKRTLRKALEYDPDLPIARKILAELDSEKK
jgi:tetratricopeptide repeat protein/cytochrome c554/c'-like protein